MAENLGEVARKYRVTGISPVYTFPDPHEQEEPEGEVLLLLQEVAHLEESKPLTVHLVFDHKEAAAQTLKMIGEALEE